jgi:D-amino-acid dehydrogenase
MVHVAVIGAGVVGATTADALLRAGHRVTLFEQAPEAASGASAANGGQLSYSYCDAMANPALLARLPGALLGRDAGMQCRLAVAPDFWRWAMAFAASSRHCQRHSDALHRLAAESATLMQRYHEDLGPRYCYREAGKLVLLGAAPDRADQARYAAKRRTGIDLRVLSPAEALAVEPALANWQGQFAAALYAPGDEVGDAQRFARALVNQLQNQGMALKMGSAVRQIEREATGSLRVSGSDFSETVDRAVLCTGSVPSHLDRSLARRYPVYPVTGYSLTLPVGAASTSVSITDLSSKVVLCRLHDQLRVAGYADLNLTPEQHRQRIRALQNHARRLAPDMAAWDCEPSSWTGHRPMTPASMPHIEETPVPGLFVNLGHGMLGWTLAAGSAARVAQLVSRSRPRSAKLPVTRHSPQHG